jgi:2'-5' RNA ligase
MRTFIAVPTTAEVRARVAALIERLNRAGASVKWVRPEQVHFTLKFLGEVDDELTPEVCNRVTEVARGVAPFHLHVQGVGAFPRRSRPRTIWLGAAEGEQQMVVLHGAIDKALLPMGFRREQRHFVPHLTVGRLRSGSPQVDALAALLERNVDYHGGTMPVQELVVMASFLDRSGPTYQPLGRMTLRGGP